MGVNDTREQLTTCQAFASRLEHENAELLADLQTLREQRDRARNTAVMLEQACAASESTMAALRAENDGYRIALEGVQTIIRDAHPLRRSKHERRALDVATKALTRSRTVVDEWLDRMAARWHDVSASTPRGKHQA